MEAQIKLLTSTTYEPGKTMSLIGHWSLSHFHRIVTNTKAIPFGWMRRRSADYVALTKPRVLSMILLTTFVGYYLGAARAINSRLGLNLISGVALAGGGTLALNQYLERDLDA